MNYMTNKIVAVQANHPSKLNPITDTSIFLAHEIQNKNYKIFYYKFFHLFTIPPKSYSPSSVGIILTLALRIESPPVPDPDI